MFAGPGHGAPDLRTNGTRVGVGAGVSSGVGTGVCAAAATAGWRTAPSFGATGSGDGAVPWLYAA